MSVTFDELKRDAGLGLILNGLEGERGEYYHIHSANPAGALEGAVGEERYHNLMIEKVNSQLLKKNPDGALYNVALQADWICHMKGSNGFTNEYTNRNERAKIKIRLKAMVSSNIVLFRDISYSRNDWGEISICFSRILQRHKIPMF